MGHEATSIGTSRTTRICVAREMTIAASATIAIPHEESEITCFRRVIATAASVHARHDIPHAGNRLEMSMEPGQPRELSGPNDRTMTRPDISRCEFDHSCAQIFNSVASAPASSIQGDRLCFPCLQGIAQVDGAG